MGVNYVNYIPEHRPITIKKGSGDFFLLLRGTFVLIQGICSWYEDEGMCSTGYS